MKVQIYDTTLRDGAQTEGVSYSLEDKIKIAKKLDSFGIHFIEGGWPTSNPKDFEFFEYFKKNPLKNAKLVSFGSTRRANVSVSEDENLRGLISAGTDFVTIFGKSWTLHVKEVLKTSLEENLKMIYESVRFLKKKNKTVIYDAEHFFDGFKSDSNYALKTLESALEGGAHIIVLCDTNGGTLPNEIEDIVKKVRKKFPDVTLGIHAHNDSGLAVANSITAFLAGCEHIQGTINGLGERCGNADLCQIIPILKLKLNINFIPLNKLKKLKELSHFVAEISNLKPDPHQPFVGESAFSHKGGVHINAVLKIPQSYEHINPELVGNQRKILISEISGKTSILSKMKKIKKDLEKTSPEVKKLHKIVQELEMQGYSFEAADASFKLLTLKVLGKYKKFFEIISFRVIDENRRGELITEATVKVEVNEKRKLTVSEGVGPVNALDSALRKALEAEFPVLKNMHLIDFKVRVLDESEGTAAKVRVLTTFQDETETWTTIGVSDNIIHASFQALIDGIEYKLFKEFKILR